MIHEPYLSAETLEAAGSELYSSVVVGKSLAESISVGSALLRCRQRRVAGTAVVDVVARKDVGVVVPDILAAISSPLAIRQN